MSPDTPEETEPAGNHGQPIDGHTNGRPADPVVSDDFGPEIPISQRELDAIQTYLGSMLRRLFSPNKPNGPP